MSSRDRGLLIAANLAYAVLLLALGLTPRLPGIADIVSDDFFHMHAYAAQAALLFLLFVHDLGRSKAAFLALAVAIAYGGCVECLQALQPARSVEMADFASNAIGAGIAALAAFLLSQGNQVGEDL
jgi:VanZ family protein